MKLRRTLIALAVAAVALVPIAALAIQPGTSGTNKENQQSGFRIGALVMKNGAATAASGAATLDNHHAGVITSESLTTTAGSDYTLTLTSNAVTASDIILWSVERGTSTTGDPEAKAVEMGAGTAIFRVLNATNRIVSAFNGQIRIKFVIVKQSALGSD